MAEGGGLPSGRVRGFRQKPSCLVSPFLRDPVTTRVSFNLVADSSDVTIYLDTESAAELKTVP